MHVAQLAGVPQDLIENARLKLDMLEAGRSDATMSRSKGEIAGQARNDATWHDVNDATLHGVNGAVLHGANDSTLHGANDAVSKQTRVIAASEPQSHANPQLSLFENIPANVVQTLQNLDLLNITPSQAIAILEELKAEVDEK
jgi:DNA mismatch repair ATPase MutS